MLHRIRRDLGRFSDDVCHELLLVTGSTAELDGMLWHDSIRSYADGKRKMLSYARLCAKF